MIFTPVEEVRLYRNSAVVRRKAMIRLQAGSNEVILSGFSSTADPDSLRLFFSADVIGTDMQLLPLAEVMDQLPSEETGKEIQELQYQIQTLQNIEKGSPTVISQNGPTAPRSGSRAISRPFRTVWTRFWPSSAPWEIKSRR